VQFQRFVLNLIRLSRYQAPRLRPLDFYAEINSGLAGRHVGCPPTEAGKRPPPGPDLPSVIPTPCILALSYMSSELGPVSPYVVTDALDNSGPAFGPRQIDLGAHPESGDLLLDGETDQRKQDYRRFFRSIENYTPTGLKRFYAEIIPFLNGKLGTEKVHQYIVGDFLDSVMTPVPDAGEVHRIVPASPSEQAAFDAVVIDFGNKWSGQTTTIIKAMVAQNRSYDTACQATLAWVQAFAPHAVGGDLHDEKRRAAIVLQAYQTLGRHYDETCAGL
jgi:hypothetical protein